MDKEQIKKEFKDCITDLFNKNLLVPLSIKDVYKAIGAKNKASELYAKEAISELIKDGVIRKFDRTKYILSKDRVYNKIYGIVSINRSYTGYVRTDNQKEDDLDVLINSDDIIRSKVLDGDKVEISIIKKDYRGRRYGKIVSVLKRTNKNIIGIAEFSDSNAFVSTIQLRGTEKIFIPKEYTKGAKNGDKVTVRILDWQKKSPFPTGKIVEVFGKSGENDTEMHAILTEFDLPYDYPRRLNNIAEKINSGITSEEIQKRRDMRNVSTFTIDPVTAKDFDDALSIRKLANGNWEVGVHIADVSFYVHKGDDIDGEGFQRATSIYLVDRTVPMLPERLSNFLCSLRPNEEKLCFSVIFEMDDNANVVNQWIGRTVIVSNRRFTYDQVQEVIDGSSDEFKDEIYTLNNLAQNLRKRRFKSGSINFERSEPQFELDEKGNPINIFFKEATQSNQLVEEFMLLANRTVAEFIAKMNKSFVYRVHDLPNKDKYDCFVQFIKRWGYKLDKNASNKKIGSELTSLLGAIKGLPEENVISNFAIRTMSRAKYTTHNIGHYGLSFEFYTHFTSPIRRYPDIMVHRLLEYYLEGGKSVDSSQLEECCEHCSSMEVKATEAERASIKYKMVEFMKDKIGNRYNGMITGLTEWGMYVELEDNLIEGMVSLQSIRNDYFEFEYKDYCVEGLRSSIRFHIGDSVRIMVRKVNLELKRLDFDLEGYYDKDSAFHKI